MGKRESAWSEGHWGEYKIGGKSTGAVKEELEYEIALWAAHTMDMTVPHVFIDGEEYQATFSVKLQRMK
jgi:CYTH domain-containing protein